MSNREYPDRPWVGVGAVVLGPDGVLLIQRGKPPRQGLWSLPGGAQKLGETFQETAVREVAEETGCKIEVLGLLDVVDSIRRDDDGRCQFHYTLVDVLGVVVAGTPTAGGDAADAKWFSYDELPALNLWQETERMIALAHEMHAALMETQP